MAMPGYRPRTLLTAGGALLALILLTLAVLTVFDVSADDAAPEKRSFGPVGDQLTISKNHGELDIRPTDIAKVEVTRRFSGRSLFGGKPKAKWGLKDEKLTLDTACGPLSQCDAQYEVLVPRDLALTVEGDNGKITATGFNTALHIGTDNGAIHVDDASGPLTLETENGELRATDLKSSRVEAGSESGNVHLSLVGVPDQVETATENGAVTVEVPDATYKVTTTTDNGDVRTDVPEDPNSTHTITSRTDNGAITLHTTE